MSKKPSRRQFLQSSAAGAGSLLAGKTILLDGPNLAARPNRMPASDRVRFGMIGVGMQGSGLLGSDTVYHGNDWDDVKPHLWNFFQAVRSRKPVVEDAVFGNHAALACHMANESYFRKKPVFWSADSRSIESQPASSRRLAGKTVAWQQANRFAC